MFLSNQVSVGLCVSLEVLFFGLSHARDSELHRLYGRLMDTTDSTSGTLELFSKTWILPVLVSLFPTMFVKEDNVDHKTVLPLQGMSASVIYMF